MTCGEACQLVLADPEGHFPWDDGYDESLRHRQRALYLPSEPERRPAGADGPAALAP